MQAVFAQPQPLDECWKHSVIDCALDQIAELLATAAGPRSTVCFAGARMISARPMTINVLDFGWLYTLGDPSYADGMSPSLGRLRLDNIVARDARAASKEAYTVGANPRVSGSVVEEKSR